jgi:hypothetical protein
MRSSSHLCSVQKMAEYSRTPCSSRSGISTAAVLCRGMLGAPPLLSKQGLAWCVAVVVCVGAPPASSVILSLVSAISGVLSFLLRLWVLGALGWAAVHEDMFSIS